MRRNLIVGWVLVLGIVACQQAPEESRHSGQEFYHVFSRPNDDTFQNSAGNAGQPYEVARVRTAMVADCGPEGAKLKMTWQATMVTGRHVEAGQYFILQRLTSNLSNLPASELSASMSVVYPPGKNRDSSTEEKKGSVLKTEIELGDARTPGRYEGELILRLHTPDLKEGNTKHFVDGGPKSGIFKKIRWSLYYDGNKISNVELNYRRGKEPQVRLIESNMVSINFNNPLHQPYPEQPRAALCYEEKVGNGEQDVESASILTRFENSFGKRVQAAGCLSCHGEGVGDNQLFCDDGKALTPSTTYPSIIAFLEDDFDWNTKNPDGQRRYRLAMKDCFIDLKKTMNNAEYANLKHLFGNRP